MARHIAPGNLPGEQETCPHDPYLSAIFTIGTDDGILSIVKVASRYLVAQGMQEIGTSARGSVAVVVINRVDSGVDIARPRRAVSDGNKPSRDASIDILKGLLVVLMTYAHTSALLESTKTLMARIPTFLGAPCCFSGFIFAFGYGSYRAYFVDHDRPPWRRILPTAGKILIAFYIVGIAWRLLVLKTGLDVTGVLRLLLLDEMPDYCQFLPAFGLVIVIAGCLHGPVRALLDNPKMLALVVVGLLATTFVPYSKISAPQLGLLIGTTSFPAFPVVQYFPLFLLGMVFAKHAIGFRRSLLVAAAVACLILFARIGVTRSIGRFPPSLTWIVGTSGGVYFLFLAARGLCHVPLLGEMLRRIGHNVLFYLVGGDMILFAVRGAYGRPLNGLGSLVATMAVIATIEACVRMVRVPKKGNSVYGGGARVENAVGATKPSAFTAHETSSAAGKASVRCDPR